MLCRFRTSKESSAFERAVHLIAMPPDLETSANAPARLQQLSQDRYERSLLQEISKLQTALLEERTATNAHRAQVEAEVSAERNRKLSESEKASRLAAMEKAIEAAQKGEQRDFLRKVSTSLGFFVHTLLTLACVPALASLPALA